jgi:predicted PurR-regulated permease PerM
MEHREPELAVARGRPGLDGAITEDPARGGADEVSMLTSAGKATRDYERYAVGAALLLLVIGCYLVVRPFLTAFLWGGILALSTRGLYERFLQLVRGRRRLAASLATLSMVAVLLVPIAAFATRVAAGAPALVARVDQMLQGGLQQPPAWLEKLPLVGRQANAWWQSAAADPERLRREIRPFVKPIREFLVAAAAGVSAGILEFGLALFIAGLLYLRGEAFGRAMDRIALRLGGEAGLRQMAVVRSTIRGVFRGMLGTCAVQAILAAIGFWIAGVPGPVLLGMGTFFLSVVPGGPTLLWLPAALWLNATGSTGMAIFLAIWGLVVVGGSDNVVRPILIGKGVEAPLALVFLGVVGGILAFGFLGLFIGPTLLAVAHNLFQEWMGGLEEPQVVKT